MGVVERQPAAMLCCTSGLDSCETAGVDVGVHDGADRALS